MHLNMHRHAADDLRPAEKKVLNVEHCRLFARNTGAPISIRFRSDFLIIIYRCAFCVCVFWWGAKANAESPQNLPKIHLPASFECSAYLAKALLPAMTAPTTAWFYVIPTYYLISIHSHTGSCFGYFRCSVCVCANFWGAKIAPITCSEPHA